VRRLNRRSSAEAGAALLGGRRLVDLLLEAAPRFPVRDLPTLHAEYPGLATEELADALIDAAARSSAAVGAAGGALAARAWAAPTTVAAFAPAQVAAETLAVAAVETKLLAELHHVYGAVPPGAAPQRALAYVRAWADRRGVDPFDPAGAGRLVAGPVRRAVRERLAGRARRNVPTLAPGLTGAALGSAANFRETAHLGRAVRNDLRRRTAATR
jgi:hypothetical protein